MLSRRKKCGQMLFKRGPQKLDLIIHNFIIMELAIFRRWFFTKKSDWKRAGEKTKEKEREQQPGHNGEKGKERERLI